MIPSDRGRKARPKTIHKLTSVLIWQRSNIEKNPKMFISSMRDIIEFEF